MNHQPVQKIELEAFDHSTALKMATKVIDLANARKQTIAVEIARLNFPVFLFVGDGLPADKLNWLRRKANIAKHFEESSLRVKHDLMKGNMSLEKTFALGEKDFLARGGAIPIFVKNAGMVATITVSGLSDEQDHQIILEALEGSFHYRTC